MTVATIQRVKDQKRSLNIFFYSHFPIQQKSKKETKGTFVNFHTDPSIFIINTSVQKYESK